MSDDFEDLEEALEDLKLDFFKDKLDKIRSKPWAEKTGSILKKTGMLVGAFGGFCPGIGIMDLSQLKSWIHLISNYPS